MRIIALSNQKGGVGKTTTSVNLGAYLAKAGNRVCILDIDPQANATSNFGFEPGEFPSIYDPLVGRCYVQELPRPTKYPNLSLIPSSMDLAGVEVELARTDDHLVRLREILHGYRPNAPFDYMLVDCPPSLGINMTSALAAVDEILIPVQCEYFAIEGLAKMIELIEELKASGANPGLYIEGVVMTMADSRTKLTEDVINQVRGRLVEMCYETIIPRNVKLSEAPSHQMAIHEYAPSSPGAKSYAALCEEFVHRHAPIAAVA